MKVRVYGPVRSWFLHNNGAWCAEISYILVERERALAETYCVFGYQASFCVLDGIQELLELCPHHVQT